MRAVGQRGHRFRPSADERLHPDEAAAGSGFQHERGEVGAGDSTAASRSIGPTWYRPVAGLSVKMSGPRTMVHARPLFD